MNSILNTIVNDKRQYVAQQKLDTPLDTFLPHVQKSDRDFYGALVHHKNNRTMAFILECKKASPSKGLIRENFNVANIASTYAPYATVTSVLTDEKYFQGSFDFLEQARGATPTPILCKDFFIDPYQVYYARHRGADAILLMLSVLDDQTYTELSTIAHDLGMGVLTEVITPTEINRATALGAKVFGINNRNLHDLSTDINRTIELHKSIPDTGIIISESGINTFSDTVHLRPYCHGFLVGSSLMAQDNIDTACRALTMGYNKVCGLTQPDHAQWAFTAGAIMGGLIFAPQSKRCITPNMAKTIIESAPLNYVGVFVNQPPQDIITIAQNLGLWGVQLHGDETDDDIAILKSALPDVVVLKAVGITPTDKTISVPCTTADYYVLDTSVNGQFGGTGQMFDWDIIPDTIKPRCLLSGGIGANEIPTAIQQKCMGLDMNSKLESPPVVKNESLVQQAFHTIKTVS